MFKQDNSINVLIGKSISRTASVNVLDPNHASYLADGEIVVLDENDTPLTAGTTYNNSKFIRIVQRSGTNLVRSARIDGANVLSFKGLSYAAPQEQISYIGYNGSSGAIDASGTKDYVLRLIFKHDKAHFSEQSNTRIYRYPNPLAVTYTDSAVVSFFAKEIANDLGAKKDAKVEILNSNAGAASTSASGTITFTNGSVTVTTSGTTPATDYPVGSYIRFGTAVTDPVYLVAAVSNSAQTITLNHPYQGTSGTLTVTNHEYITSANAIAADFGIKLTGLAQDFLALKLPYTKVKFDVTLSGWGTTTIDKAQESKPGSGVGYQVVELEQFAIGNEGAVDRFNVSAPVGRQDAVGTSNYDIITIEYKNSYDTMVVSGEKPSKSLLYMALIDGAAQSATILGQLNPWMASLPNAFSNVAV